MGNRAVILSASDMLASGEINPWQIGVYLHWNGGRDSVEGFLEYCRLRDFRPPEVDGYGWARLCQVVGNFFGGDGLSVSIGYACQLDLDNGDNGVYIISDWKIVGRKYEHEEQREYGLYNMLLSIDESQPEDQQIKDFLLAEEVSVTDINIGDQIIMFGIGGRLERHNVVGVGMAGKVNGRNVAGVPFVDKYKNDGDYSWNINNYLMPDVRFRRVCIDG